MHIDIVLTEYKKKKQNSMNSRGAIGTIGTIWKAFCEIVVGDGGTGLLKWRSQVRCNKVTSLSITRDEDNRKHS